MVVTAILALVAIALTGVTLYRLEKHMSTNQERLNALSAQLGAVRDQTSKAYNEIVTEIEALKVKSADLDFGLLESAVADLGASAQRLDDIVADPETEPVEDEGDEPELPGDEDPEVPGDEDGPATETPSA